MLIFPLLLWDLQNHLYLGVKGNGKLGNQVSFCVLDAVFSALPQLLPLILPSLLLFPSLSIRLYQKTLLVGPLVDLSGAIIRKEPGQNQHHVHGYVLPSHMHVLPLGDLPDLPAVCLDFSYCM